MSDGLLAGKGTVITGAASEIGRETAKVCRADRLALEVWKRTLDINLTAPPTLVTTVRRKLALDGVPIAGGTTMYFCELNRTRPQVEAMDGVFWSLNGRIDSW
jgi:hypothetical protein